MKPRGGDAFLRGRTDWITAACPGSHGQLATRAGFSPEPRRLQGPGLPTARCPLPAQFSTVSARRREGLGCGPGRVQEAPSHQGPVLSTALPQSFHPEQETVLEPPPAPAPFRFQSSLSALISTQSLGEAVAPTFPRGQHWVWGPLSCWTAVNKSTPWLPATLHSPLERWHRRRR